MRPPVHPDRRAPACGRGGTAAWPAGLPLGRAASYVDSPVGESWFSFTGTTPFRFVSRRHGRAGLTTRNPLFDRRKAAEIVDFGACGEAQRGHGIWTSLTGVTVVRCAT